jgi:hypothetical protein
MQDFTSHLDGCFRFILQNLTQKEIFIGVKLQIIHETLSEINISDVLLDKEQYNFRQ